MHASSTTKTVTIARSVMLIGFLSVYPASMVCTLLLWNGRPRSLTWPERSNSALIAR
jgi:hypothetical protein